MYQPWKLVGALGLLSHFRDEKTATSTHWADDIPEGIAINFGTSHDLRTIIIRAKSGFDWSKGSSVSRPLKIGLYHRKLTSPMQQCIALPRCNVTILEISCFSDVDSDTTWHVRRRWNQQSSPTLPQDFGAIHVHVSRSRLRARIVVAVCAVDVPTWQSGARLRLDQRSSKYDRCRWQNLALCNAILQTSRTWTGFWHPSHVCPSTSNVGSHQPVSHTEHVRQNKWSDSLKIIYDLQMCHSLWPYLCSGDGQIRRHLTAAPSKPPAEDAIEPVAAQHVDGKFCAVLQFKLMTVNASLFSSQPWNTHSLRQQHQLICYAADRQQMCNPRLHSCDSPTAPFQTKSNRPHAGCHSHGYSNLARIWC